MKQEFKILIVEDELIIAQCLKMELEISGYDICSFVSSGEEAIIEAKRENPDIIVMDIHLSGKLDGIETAKEININRKIPIIVCTGYTENELFIRAKKEVNPVAYLRKPIITVELIRAIESVFK